MSRVPQPASQLSSSLASMNSLQLMVPQLHDDESDGHLRKLLSPQLGRSGSPAQPPWLLPPVLTAATWGATVTLEWTQHTSICFSTFSGRTWHQECFQVLSGRGWSGSEEAGRFDARLFANAVPRLISYRRITMSLALTTRVDRKVVTHIRKSVHCGQRGAPGGVGAGRVGSAFLSLREERTAQLLQEAEGLLRRASWSCSSEVMVMNSQELLPQGTKARGLCGSHSKTLTMFASFLGNGR